MLTVQKRDQRMYHNTNILTGQEESVQFEIQEQWKE